MSSLVEKLRRQVQDKDITVSALLREAKVVAARLNLPESPAWIDQELNGYQPHASGVAYRCVPNRWTSRPVGETVWKPIARALNDNGVAVDAISYTVPEIERYLSSNSGSETVIIPWFSPPGIVPDYPSDFQIEIGRSQLIKILDAVRNRVFEWSLQLERHGITGQALNELHASSDADLKTEAPNGQIQARSEGTLELRPSTSGAVDKPPGINDVMVVHGRNTKARDAMFDFLRALELKPIEWEGAVRAAGGGSPYTGHVVKTAIENAGAVIVLLTADDLAKLRSMSF
jgi:hypothetical protein